MAHGAQVDFCYWVKSMHPDYFYRPTVIDVGSLDINGNNRQFFHEPNYTGIDIVQGKNVDIVGKAHEVLPNLPQADVIISTEMLEHDKFWNYSLDAMWNKLKKGGLLLITAGGDCRHEHGTHNHTPQDSPLTNDYYRNISNEMFSNVMTPGLFKEYYLRQIPCDIQFYGIKS